VDRRVFVAIAGVIAGVLGAGAVSKYFFGAPNWDDAVIVGVASSTVVFFIILKRR